MNPVAFLYGDITIYWDSIILALASATGILLFLAASARSSEGIAAAAIASPGMVLLSLIFGRLLHWYFLRDSYESFQSAMTSFGGGGYVLAGAFGACLLTALVMKLSGMVKNLSAFLDCMAIGGCGAIALGRLSFFFSGSGRGDILTGLTALPWAAPVVNATSGGVEYRFAAFFIQALIAGLIFVVLLWLFYRRHRDGDVTVVFLLLYCASQAVLDSTRYDGVRLRSNGFISLVQVLSALCLAALIGILSLRVKRLGRWKPWYPVFWGLTAASLGGAAYMEYYVQRHSGEALFAYLTMSGCLLVTVAVGIALLSLSNQSKRRFLRA